MENKEFKKLFQEVCLNEDNELTEVGCIVLTFMAIAIFRMLLPKRKEIKENEKK